MFVPLVHPPGHAQADFGEAIGVIGGVERKIHFFAMDLPHSDAPCKNATRRIPLCCARSPSGHAAAAAPPTRAMNSRRPMKAVI
jgi:transposase